jgi:prepilin-type processing-associated H-X9-DG protein
MDYITNVGDGGSYTLLITENVNACWWPMGGKMAPREFWGDPQTDSTRKDPLKALTVFLWHDDAESIVVRKINNKDNKGSLLELYPADYGDINLARPSSFHTGGVNVVFCDTRTLFIGEHISYRVYQHLMTPNGRHVVCDDAGVREALQNTVLSDDMYQ